MIKVMVKMKRAVKENGMKVCRALVGIHRPMGEMNETTARVNLKTRRRLEKKSIPLSDAGAGEEISYANSAEGALTNLDYPSSQRALRKRYHSRLK
jgi:hypothetical protein